MCIRFLVATCGHYYSAFVTALWLNAPPIGQATTKRLWLRLMLRPSCIIRATSYTSPLQEEGEYVVGNIYGCMQKEKNYSIINKINDVRKEKTQSSYVDNASVQFCCPSGYTSVLAFAHTLVT